MSLTVGEVACLIEMVVKRGMGGSELLCRLHFPKSLYRSLWSSTGHRAVFRLIAAHLTTMGIAACPDGSVAASRSIGNDVLSLDESVFTGGSVSEDKGIVSDLDEVKVQRRGGDGPPFF